MIFLIFGKGNTINVYMYNFFQLNLRIVDSFEIILTVILWSSIMSCTKEKFEI